MATTELAPLAPFVDKTWKGTSAYWPGTAWPRARPRSRGSTPSVWPAVYPVRTKRPSATFVGSAPSQLWRISIEKASLVAIV